MTNHLLTICALLSLVLVASLQQQDMPAASKQCLQLNKHVAETIAKADQSVAPCCIFSSVTLACNGTQFSQSK
jgi:hypothetical protein